MEKLFRIIKFALVPYRKDANSILRRQEAVKGDIAGLAVGNHELAQFTLDCAANQRVIGEGLDGLAYGVGSSQRGMRVLPGDEFERTLKVAERSL